MKKASHFGLVIARIFILLSTSILISIRSFSTPLGTTAQHIFYDPTGMSDGTTGSVEAFFRFTFKLDIQLNSFPHIGQALINVDDDYDFLLTEI